LVNNRGGGGTHTWEKGKGGNFSSPRIEWVVYQRPWLRAGRKRIHRGNIGGGGQQQEGNPFSTGRRKRIVGEEGLLKRVRTHL